MLAILSERDVRELLPQSECIDVMAKTMVDLANGDTVQPLRDIMPLLGRDRAERKGVLGMMPAQIDASIDAHGIKVVSVFPGNHGTAYDAHQGVVVLFEPVRGCPVAVLDGSEVTAIRTGAVSAVATRVLARADAVTLGLVGAGIQAATHLDAIRCVRDIERVNVWSRRGERAARFAAEQSVRHGIPVVAVSSVREAVVDCAVVCVVTTAGEPVVEGAWLAPGTHVNAVGACFASKRELDSEAVRRSRLYADRIESLENESGDFLFPLREGVIASDHVVGEIGQVLIGQVEGRRSDDEITLFKALGLGIEDVAAGWHVLKKARECGMGTWVDFGSAPDVAD